MIESDCAYHGNVLMESENISDPEQCFQLSEVVNGQYYVYESNRNICTIYDNDYRTCGVQRGANDVDPSSCPR